VSPSRGFANRIITTRKAKPKTEGGEEEMTRDYVLWHLREAAEALTNTIAEMTADGNRAKRLGLRWRIYISISTLRGTRGMLLQRGLTHVAPKPSESGVSLQRTLTFILALNECQPGACELDNYLHNGGDA